jgi:predicted MFS family arabinose efflux permease
LADRLGRPVVLYAGTSIFTIFEAISAWAPYYPILIVGRAMTGIAAAASTPTVYTIIADPIAYQARGRVMSIASVRWILRFYNYWSAARPLAFLRHRFGWVSGSVIGLLFLCGLANLAGNLALGRLGDQYGKERAVRVG